MSISLQTEVMTRHLGLAILHKLVTALLLRVAAAKHSAPIHPKILIAKLEETGRKEMN